MAYISVKEAAEKWEINETLVRRYCRQGRIPWAKQIDGSWMIPENAKKPGKVEVVSKPKEPPVLARKLKNQKKKKNYHGLYDHVQINLTYSSSRMASNRLTRDQVETLFRKGKVRVSFEPMKASDINEVINHFVCVDYVLDHVMDKVSQTLIQKLHYLLMFGTVDHRKSRVNPGAYRKDNTPRSLPSMPKAADITACLSQLISGYEKLPEIGMKEILDFHVRFEEIVPFEDGNGRVGRLIMFKECLRNDVMPFILDDKRRHQYLSGVRSWHSNPILLMDVVSLTQERFEKDVSQLKLGEYRDREFVDIYSGDEPPEPIDEFAADEEEQKRRKKENYTD